MTHRLQHRAIASRSARWPLFPALLILLMALSLTPAVTGAPEEPQAAQEQDYTLFNRGSIAYQRYCSSCHGSKARGDGQVARLLKVPPADLTQLAVNNQGEFPEQEAHEMIDGRKAGLGVSLRDMPLFGPFFLGQAEGPEAEEKAQRRIDELVAYLKGIQES